MTDVDKQSWKDRIDKMDQMEMADLYRNAWIGHPVFDMTTGLHEYFQKRFKAVGGMTTAISKATGW